MPTVLTYENAQSPLSTRAGHGVPLVKSFRSERIPFTAGFDNTGAWAMSLRRSEAKPRPANSRMPSCWAMLTDIRTPRWQRLANTLPSVRLRCGRPVSGWPSPEKKTVLYRERNEQARLQFQEELESLEPESLVYLDESGVDASLHRPYGRAPRGTKVMGEVCGTRAHRISLIAALNDSHLLAPMRFEGYCDTQVFNTWLEQVLLPELKPGQTVIMDNASFHKSSKTQHLITSKGCMLKYLPTYSPDLNPIEHHWAILKARLRKVMAPLQSLEQALDETLMVYQ